MKRTFPVSLALLASTAFAQVKLNTAVQPAAGYAGVTIENLTGSGFPSGAVSPAQVTIALSKTCNGTPVVTATATTVTAIAGTTKRLSFALPATAVAGTYSVSVQGRTNTGAPFASSNCSSLTVLAQSAFVKVTNGQLTLNGQPYRFAGGNSYVLLDNAHSEIDQILQTAVNDQFRVVRTWGWLDIGNQDGTNSVRGISNGFYYQYWNGSAPAYNDGANGLQNLDYTIYRAGQLGLKLIIPFTNNWTDFGGMDQYVRWANGAYHDQFYTDLTIRAWYEEWISHLLNHVNPYTGIAYRNDPTILIWELANEPRCTGSGAGGGGYPSTSWCTTATITNWAAAASAYVKSVDSNHLVSVGDEGFFCNPNASSSDWIENCSQGDDTVALAKLPDIDLMGFHLYPEGWGQTIAWADNYVDQHVSAAAMIGKPAYLGEYGLLAGDTRNATYRDWTSRILRDRGAGALFWDIAAGTPGAAAAENDQSFDLEDSAPLLTTLRNFAETMAANTELAFAPVADDQWASTPFGQTATLNPLQNDIAYAGAMVNPATIDLDPATPGIQTTRSVYGGEFTVTDGTVSFAPSANFNGSSQVPYNFHDSNNQLSNTAFLNVYVKPSEGATELIESFETGTDGWGPISSGGGTVSQSTTFHTDGTHSLQVNAVSSGWFGVSFPSTISLAGRPSLSIDVHTTGMGGGTAIAFQSGSGYTWCQTKDPWPSLAPNTSTTITIPLQSSSLNCGSGTPDLTQIHTFYVYLDGPGTYYLDNLRAGAVSASNLPVTLDSFETGTDSWHPVNSPTDGTVSQTSAFHTDGAYSLQIVDTKGDWFGRSFAGGLNLTGKKSVSIDIDSITAGSGVNIAIQSGSAWTWCQGNAWPYASGPDTTLTVQFSDMSCAVDLTQIDAIWVYVNPGTYDVDYLRAE